MAKALIVDDSYGKLVPPYYKNFPCEPISATANLSVVSTSLVQNTSFDTLLDAIIATVKSGDADKDLVVAMHGNSAGMYVPLHASTSALASTANLDGLTGTASAAEKQKVLRLSAGEVTSLLAKIDAVRALGLGHVAFRGCTIGGNVKNLETLKACLGAKVVTGTSLYSTFGEAPPLNKTKKEMDKLVVQMKDKTHLWTGDKGRVLFDAVPKKSDPLFEIIALYVESKDAILPWLQSVFWAGATTVTATAVRNRIPVHYLSRRPATLPLDGRSKSPTPVGYADFIFASS